MFYLPKIDCPTDTSCREKSFRLDDFNCLPCLLCYEHTTCRVNSCVLKLAAIAASEEKGAEYQHI